MDYLILALATWRISNLLTGDSEAGPFSILDYIRTYGRKLSGAFECLWCMSILMGVILTALYLTIPDYTTWICLPFALSTVAIIIDRVM